MRGCSIFAPTFGKRKVVKMAFITESLNYWQLNIHFFGDVDTSFYVDKFRVA